MVDGRSLRYAGRRGELLDAAGAWVLQNGISSVSIRRVAAGMGISHRTLLHHFVSKEQLISEVLASLRRQNLEALTTHAGASDTPDPVALVVQMWEHFAAPSHLPYHRLYFEACGLALENPDRFGAFLENSISDWQNAIDRLLLGADIPQARRLALTTLVLAGFRGLILQVLLTGDEPAARSALEELAAQVGGVT